MLPVLILGGIAVGIGSGYVIDKAFGDGNYTRNEIITDGILGAIPGVGWAGIAGRSVNKMRHFRHFDRSVDVISDIPALVVLANRKEIKPIIKTITSSVLVQGVVDRVFVSSKSYQQNVGKGPSGKSRSPVSRVAAKKATKRFVKKSPKYCKLHRKYDYCYNK